MSEVRIMLELLHICKRQSQAEQLKEEGISFTEN
jgi:hypothetical protein